MQYISTVQCSILVQYSTVQYSTVQYSTVQYSTIQYNTVQYSTVQALSRGMIKRQRGVAERMRSRMRIRIRIRIGSYKSICMCVYVYSTVPSVLCHQYCASYYPRIAIYLCVYVYIIYVCIYLYMRKYIRDFASKAWTELVLR